MCVLIARTFELKVSRFVLLQCLLRFEDDLQIGLELLLATELSANSAHR